MSIFNVKIPAPAATRAPDLAEVRRALTILVDPDDGATVVGIPVGGGPPSGHTFRGADLDGLVRMAGVLAERGNVYYVLNPVLATFNRGAGVPNDSEILRRRWLLIDIDTQRPLKTKQGATDVERASSWPVAVQVHSYLTSHGWPEPITIDSGNGWHLLYKCDLPNSDYGKRLVKTFLNHLADRFDCEAADVDRVVYPAKQIAKLPGTWAMKGDNLEDRPWRLAKLLDVPTDLSELVTGAMLVALVGEPAEGRRQAQPVVPTLPPGGGGNGNGTHTAPLFSVPVAPADDQAARLAGWLKAALASECDVLAAAELGKNLNDQLNRSAFRMGQLIHLGLDESTARADLLSAAQRAGADSPAKDQSTLNRGLAAGKENPRSAPDLDSPHVAEAAPILDPAGWSIVIGGEVVRTGKAEELAALSARPKTSHQDFTILSLGELLTTEFPRPDWAISGLLAEGLNMLAGSPKSGKSMMALNLALTVAGGGLALGNIRTIPGDVLYLSLEDQFRRVQDRARKMLALAGELAKENLSVVTKWPRQHRGGLALMREWIDRARSPRLVIIDVFGKFRPPLGKGNQYEQDSEHMYAIKEFTDDNRLTGLVLHHTRKLVGKEKDRDEMEDVSGTQGLTGACDGILMLKRARQSNDATLSVTGRDDAEQKLALLFNPEALTWTSSGSAEDHMRGKLQLAILAHMKARIGCPVFVSDLAADLQAHTESIRTVLHRMFKEGIIQRVNSAWVYPAAGVDP